MRQAFKYVIPIMLCASLLSAEEAQVREVRTEGAVLFDHSVSSINEDGSFLSFTVVSAATTVSYERVVGDPLTDADADVLAATVFVCDGYKMQNQDRVVTPDQIVFTYDCMRVDE